MSRLAESLIIATYFAFVLCHAHHFCGPEMLEVVIAVLYGTLGLAHVCLILFGGSDHPGGHFPPPFAGLA